MDTSRSLPPLPCLPALTRLSERTPALPQPGRRDGRHASQARTATVITVRDVRHPVRGGVQLQRHARLTEHWGWPGLAALGCAALAAALWLTQGDARPAPATGATAAGQPQAVAPTPAPQAVLPEGTAARRLDDLAALVAWMGRQELQWRAATYQLAVADDGLLHWTLEAQLQGAPADLEQALAQLPRDFAHLRVDDLRLSQGPGRQLLARVRLELHYRPATGR